jgi:hypothetical protein
VLRIVLIRDLKLTVVERMPRDPAFAKPMVAGINAGIEQRLFTVRRGDNRWPGVAGDTHDRRGPHVFHFMVGAIPALGSVSDAGWDELAMHVTFWPTVDGERWVRASNAGFLAGELFASGWLERRDGTWLQVASKPEFSCRKSRPAVAATLRLDPRGYADRGSFKM